MVTRSVAPIYPLNTLQVLEGLGVQDLGFGGFRVEGFFQRKIPKVPLVLANPCQNPTHGAAKPETP